MRRIAFNCALCEHLQLDGFWAKELTTTYIRAFGQFSRWDIAHVPMYLFQPAGITLNKLPKCYIKTVQYYFNLVYYNKAKHNRIRSLYIYRIKLVENGEWKTRGTTDRVYWCGCGLGKTVQQQQLKKPQISRNTMALSQSRNLWKNEYTFNRLGCAGSSVTGFAACVLLKRKKKGRKQHGWIFRLYRKNMQRLKRGRFLFVIM